MVRIAKDIDYNRLEELKKKINDDTYLELAVQTIAQQLTQNFVKKED